jgi:hypothetical protein
MASRTKVVARWAALFVALALVAAACSNDKGSASADRPHSAPKAKAPADDSAGGGTTDDSTVDPPATPTTATANGQQVTGRQLVQASRARFTRPLPTVVPTGPVAVPTPTTTPPTAPPGDSDPGGTGPGDGGPKDPPTADDDRSSQELIAADVDKGLITYSHSLLYRAYALFWDPRLPAQYDGIGSTGEDNELFVEARENAAQIDPAVQAELARFLERPASPQGYGCPLTDNAGQPVSWQDSGTASAHFKVWACGTNGAADDIALVATTLDELYAGLADPTAMGPAVPDTAGGDTRTDVYLLDTIATRERAGKQAPIDGTTVAATVADAPFAPPRASSYLLIGRPRLGDRGVMRRTLAHQLFHALQYAHNYDIETADPGRSPWFFEASAAWAEWQFFRSGSAAIHDEYFTAGFLSAPDLPLEIASAASGVTPPERSHPRWAYLWPFFMQQQAGGDPAAVFDTWRAVEPATDWNAFHAAIDGELPFATSFRDFAVRNLNADLGPASEPHYDGLDPQFPVGVRPVLSSDFEVTQPGTIELTLGGPGASGLRSLSSQYDLVAIGPQSNTRTLGLDFEHIPKGVDITVLTQDPSGTWTRHDVPPGQRIDFDFTDPAAVVSKFYVVLDNHDREPNWAKPGGGLLGGSYSIVTAS